MAMVVALGVAVFASPIAGRAAAVAPSETGIVTVAVTTYQHANPLPGVWVFAAVNSVPVWQPETYKAVTDQNGIATLKLPAGTYHVTTHVTALLDPYEPWAQDVTVLPGTYTKVPARLLITAEMYPLAFRVIDPLSLLGVTDADVRIVDAQGQTIAHGATNAKGVFDTRAPKGVFMAAVQHPMYEGHKDFVQVFADTWNGTTVALAPLGHPSLGDMEIYVYEAGSYTLIKEAAVTLYEANGNVLDQGMTDAKGTYYTCLPAGKYRVEVTAPGYTRYDGAHLIVAGGNTYYKVLLQPIDR
jgi:hypothetical protein